MRNHFSWEVKQILKENASQKKSIFFMNMEIVTNFEVVKLGHRIVML